MADRYPESRTSPILKLGLEGMSVNAADDMLILDSSVSPAVFSGNVTGFTIDKINSGNIGSGNVDLYTVPAGKRAIVSLTVFNTTVSSINVTPKAKLGGSSTYTTLSAGQTVTTLSSNTLPTRIVLEAGDILAVTTQSTGINVFGTVLLFDNTSCLLSPRLTTLTAGDNTLYTCPPNTKTYFIGCPAWVYGSANNPLMTIVNNSGSTQSYKVNIVPSGSSPSANNQMIAANSLVNTDVTGPQIVAALSAGDTVSVNTTGTGTQLVYCVLVELPA